MKKIILLILFVNILFANAQTGISNTGIMQIHTGTQIKAVGDFTNTASAAFVNNGSLYVAGNINNSQAGMLPGTGTLYIDGSAAQTISGSQVFKTYNLITNNASGITLNNNLSVSGNHTCGVSMVTTYTQVVI